MFKKREKKATTISVEDTAERSDNLPSDNNVIQSHSNEYLNRKRAHFSTKESNQNEIVQEMLSDLKYKSTLALQNNNNATREIEVDTEKDKDATAIRMRNMQISKDKLEGKIKEDQYMGKDATIVYAEKSERDISRYKVTGSLGPMRAPTNLRATCRFDYAHGICKDYKETGYCGFGDNCVFVHDRSDYKTGWEEEEDWRREQLKKQKLIKEGKYVEDAEDHSACDSHEEEDDNESKIPKTCQICDNEFISPVFTKCFHYFCEKCALSHYAKTSSCYVCKKPSQGIFNNAEKLIAKVMERRKKNSNKKEKTENYKEETVTQINDGYSSLDNMEYLNRENRTNIINFNEEEQDDEFGFKNYKSEVIKKQKKKNNFKSQNGLEFISDYKSYV